MLILTIVVNTLLTFQENARGARKGLFQYQRQTIGDDGTQSFRSDHSDSGATERTKDMDIQSASSAAAQIPQSGTAGAAESAANVSKIASDSSQERKEVEKSDPGNHTGRRVDVSA
jgi:hypothetical protein